MRGRAKAAKRRFDELIASAWHVEAFARTKTLPKLADVLAAGAEDRPRYKSNAAMMADLDALVEATSPREPIETEGN